MVRTAGIFGHCDLSGSLRIYSTLKYSKCIYAIGGIIVWRVIILFGEIICIHRKRVLHQSLLSHIFTSPFPILYFIYKIRPYYTRIDSVTLSLFTLKYVPRHSVISISTHPSKMPKIQRNICIISFLLNHSGKLSNTINQLIPSST